MGAFREGLCLPLGSIMFRGFGKLGEAKFD
jgi:hypothetical protein